MPSLLPHKEPSHFEDSPVARALRQPLLLGLFLPIQDGGWSPSTLPRSTTWTFDYNAALTLRAEQLGFDLVFGLAQWVGKGGHGGVLRYREQSIDPFITTASLAALTRRILLISTIHVLYGPWHPLHIAKFGATLDHISKGRWGINVVTGNAADEPPMFGARRIEHDERYERTDEFISVVKRLWGEDENLSHDGRYYKLENAYVSPRPLHGRPLLVNAAGSKAGIDYAAKHSDIMFITSPAGAEIEAALGALPAHTAAIRKAAAERGRHVRTIINPTIVSRPTDSEAHAYHDAIITAEDAGAADGFHRRGQGSDSQSWLGHKREHRVLGGNIQIIGSPQTVVDKLLRLKEADVDGVQLTFFDFQPDLEFFGQRILPLMREAGLRLPAEPGEQDAA
jgi:FMNH2-dependent dimethyl sulfone monooxygenase